MVVPIVSGKERLKHPTQKPEKIIELFIKYWSNEGDIILDPFAGTGTTLKVARDLKRSCIGIEINPEYFEIAKKRIEIIS
jgi:DNA modification methylase